MPQPDVAWWQINGVPVVAAVVGSALALFLGVALRRWLELLERDRAADAHARAIAQAAERGASAPEAPPQRRILWVRSLPWIAALAGAAALADVFGWVPVRVTVAPLTWLVHVPMITLGGKLITTGSVIALLLTISVGRWVSVWAQRAVGRRMRSHPHTRDGVVESVQRLMHAVLMALFVVGALQALGADLSAVFAASAVFAIGLGFGLQTLTTHFVSGIVLLVERTIKPGDVIQVEGRLVRITELGLRSTTGRTLDDEDVIIPNAKLLDSYVVNYSLHSDVVRARALVGVSYTSDVDEVVRVLQACADGFPLRVSTRDPVVMLRGFGSSSIDFEVSVWLQDAFVREVALSSLRIAMWRALTDAGIVFAFPQLDVHLDAPAVPVVGPAVPAVAPVVAPTPG